MARRGEGAPAAIELLANEAAARIDAAAIAGGTPGIELMENAGRAVTREITRRYPPSRCLVLCGPGNNGGDGFVVARRLQDAGWRVGVVTDPAWRRCHGDAALAQSRWLGPTMDLSIVTLEGVDLIVDALFGSGLSRPLDGPLCDFLRRVAATLAPIVAIDVPSGVDGSTGLIHGFAPQADLTVTFTRPKLGHLLEPGRSRCGTLVTAAIGIADDLVATELNGARLNGYSAWQHCLPKPSATSHKYDKGHVIVAGGPKSMTGAAIMAARAALSAGSGLVSIACDSASLPVYASHLQAVMTKPVEDIDGLKALVSDARVRALVAGPGMQPEGEAAERVVAMLAAGKPLVLDAGALALMAMDKKRLLPLVHEQCVLTPHHGEFARLFGAFDTRVQGVRAAARTAGCTVLLKGPDTLIAAPDGRLLVNSAAPRSLATAGSGDVLAGTIAALLGQGMPPFEAAAAGCWLHSAAARLAGPLESTADLIPALADVARRLGAQATSR